MSTLSSGPVATPRVLAFDPAGHVYRVDGAPVPSVTQLLDDAGLTPDYSVVPPTVLQHARDRGLHIDACCDLLDADDLDWRSVHPEALPYVEAWMAFREYEGFTPVAAQVPLYHPTYGYAGTADAVGLLPGNRPVIVERKSTAKMAATYALQTAGYAQDGMWYAPPGGGVLAPVPWVVPGRLGVQLRLTWLGGRRILERLERIDFDVFGRRPALGPADVPVLLWRLASWRRG